MTTALDTKLTKVAKDLLAKFGMTVDYTQVSGGTHDPLINKVTGETTAVISTKIVPPSPVNDRMIDGEIYKIGDQVTFIAAKDLAFVPVAARDTIVIGGETFSVIASRKIHSGDEIALYEIGLRKGAGDVRSR